MAENSKIEWTDHTFNPWIGCTKVSPGCAHCYAETLMDKRYGRVRWGKGQPRQRTSASNWRLPLRWNRDAELQERDAEARDRMPPRRPRVFCASLADWLDDEVPIEWLADLLELIRETPHLDWLLLTKRPQNWRTRLEAVLNHVRYIVDYALLDNFVRLWLGGWAPENVWAGTTVEDRQRADERIPELILIPARVRFLSCEPLPGRVNLHGWLTDGGCLQPHTSTPEFLGKPQIHWVIAGGESGPGARPLLVEYADNLRRQCAAAGVAFFMKQLGAHVGTTNANAHDWPEHVEFHEVMGTPQAASARVVLRDKKGGDFDEFPSELQVRQFPEAAA